MSHTSVDYNKPVTIGDLMFVQEVNEMYSGDKNKYRSPNHVTFSYRKGENTVLISGTYLCEVSDLQEMINRIEDGKKSKRREIEQEIKEAEQLLKEARAKLQDL